MPLTTKPINWKLARDLALLSIASYKSRKSQQANNSDATNSAMEEE